MHALIHTCISMHTHTYIHRLMYVWLNIYINVYTYICIHAHTCLDMWWHIAWCKCLKLDHWSSAIMSSVNKWMGDHPTSIATKVWYLTMPSCAVLHIHMSGIRLGKKGCVLSCLCDWCTLKNVWSIGICPTTILLPTRYECEMRKYVDLKAGRGRHCPTWCGRLVCSPGNWYGRRWFLLNIKEWQRKELGLS